MALLQPARSAAPSREAQLGAAQQAGQSGTAVWCRERRTLQQWQQRQQQLGTVLSQLQALQGSQRKSQEERLRKQLL